MLKDAEDTLIEDDATDEEANEIYCAACGHLVTRAVWRMTFDGAHEHTLFNPAGILFRVLCFKEVPGADTPGGPQLTSLGSMAMPGGSRSVAGVSRISVGASRVPVSSSVW